MASSYAKFIPSSEALRYSRVLVPADEETEEQFNAAPMHKHYALKFQREMNSQFKRMVERAIRDLYENQDRYESEDVHRTSVKLEIGWVYDEPVIRNGETHWVVKPLDFYNCKQADLESFWQLLFPLMVKKLGIEWAKQYERHL